MRCAPLGPTPGRRPSSSIRSWTAPSYTGSETRQAQPAGERTHPVLSEIGGRTRGVTNRGDNEVLQSLDIVRIDGLGVDLKALELAGSAHGCAHQPAPGMSFDLEVGELLLRGHQLLLHLLSLLHELLHVGLRRHAVSLRRWRAQLPSMRSMTCALSSDCNNATASAGASAGVVGSSSSSSV